MGLQDLISMFSAVEGPEVPVVIAVAMVSAVLALLFVFVAIFDGALHNTKSVVHGGKNGQCEQWTKRNQDECVGCVSTPPSNNTDSAEHSWSQKHGRYKHCYLRLDPLASEHPPSYSLVNLDLPLPDISFEERCGLRELAAMLQDFNGKHHRTDDATLLRFLRARKGDVTAAALYFRKSVAYRDELNIPYMETKWNLEAYEHCFAPWWVRGGIVGYSLAGGIVGWERYGLCRFPQLLEALPWDVLQKLDAVHMVRTLAALEEDSMRRRVWFGKAILVLDLYGLSLGACNPNTARRYGKLVEYRDMLMPNTLTHIFIIRAPRAFSAAWSVVKQFLDPTTRDKVQIVSGNSNSLALLRCYISNEFIPGYIGGGLHPKGDPECCQILGSSSCAPVPEDAISRLRELTSGTCPPKIVSEKVAPEVDDWTGCLTCLNCCRR